MIRRGIIPIVVTAVAAAIVGYFVGRQTNVERPLPIAPSQEIVTKVLAAHEEGHDFDSLDPIIRKHLTLQIWYSGQAGATGILGAESGHEFGQIWKRSDPIEILEEQLEFMPRWLEDLAELERGQAQGDSEDRR